MEKANLKTSNRSGQESGEVSAEESMPTPLGRIHTNKMIDVATPKLGGLKEKFNAKAVKDSLDRPKKASKRPRKISESSSDSSGGIEDSFISALGKKARGSSISLKDVGLLQNRDFLKQLSVPDRRELGGIRNWSERFNTLFELIKSHGGSSYMDFTETLDSHRESLELYGDCQYWLFQVMFLSPKPVLSPKLLRFETKLNPGGKFDFLQVELIFVFALHNCLIYFYFQFLYFILFIFFAARRAQRVERSV